MFGIEEAWRHLSLFSDRKAVQGLLALPEQLCLSYCCFEKKMLKNIKFSSRLQAFFCGCPGSEVWSRCSSAAYNIFLQKSGSKGEKKSETFSFSEKKKRNEQRSSTF